MGLLTLNRQAPGSVSRGLVSGRSSTVLIVLAGCRVRHLSASARLSHLPAGAACRRISLSAEAAHFTAPIFRTVIGGHVSAIVGIGSVGVDGSVAIAITGQIQCAAVDGQITIGVNAVTVGYNGEFSAVDHDPAVLIGHTRGIGGTVRRIQAVVTITEMLDFRPFWLVESELFPLSSVKSFRCSALSASI